MIRLLIIVCFLALLTVFSLSNPSPSEMWIISKGFHISIGLLAFGLSIFFLFVGLIVGWAGEFQQRRRARRAENQIRSLEKQNSELQDKVASLQISVPNSTSNVDHEFISQDKSTLK
ncbi:DUF1049 domain-containing protein [Aristophania vespae]|uniref:DUF1049 domain-containing protein n=1 Tax=Aristophania vespae TaxID=2697033 RepID=A0A6P1NIN4_9PROT|nr:lipopolysaccharide assembly protein LapA domain-containing protein [Aristophania vespae]QHI95522.1 DUF1049 domain-containing protein [Aristophania vespae]UMM63173.1 hypothetical protein DM15PD_01290 [Aristophania vespae]